ncbi:cytosine/adenosine deaminase-related metal-dependent hydrolase [Amycolatopsis lexingtonensis]|uniref:Cytosine/adenosine deaminase-related metal-dependent hydrolase n=1 Tax=Amycolatopsis lexingtonensis TaxID=218822 RepID=A0ABR9HYS6_9PSEU|nr:amidohydrolase family protein [Amycolatopsis lexingtonensis]MBE1496083.1 cytosine/adenosine deaminase-related metal-dependent hydrolase [Amycolatopsis lexingtonensis]
MNRTLLRGARVITMAPHRPDAEHADILIDGDTIAAVGENLDATGAEVVDIAGRIIMPGLVNAHLHTWQTALRGVGTDWTLADYLGRLHGAVARHYRPEDMRVGTLAGALDQLDRGTTTLGDWCHNTPTPDHTDAALDGLRASGVRGVFLHGTAYSAPDAAHPVDEIDRVTGGPLLTLGMAVRGPQLSTPDTAVADFRAAAERGLVVSLHQSGGAPGPAWAAVRAAGLLGPATDVVHGAGLTEEWLEILVDAGASLTSTPENELGQGHGLPVTGHLLRLGAAPSLGTDTDVVTPADVLSAARIALAHQRGHDHEDHRRATGSFSLTATITAKQALAWATVEGARALGLADRVGRLDAGMQADLIVIDAPGPNPVAAALHATAGDIEAVMIAGHWRKRDHTLLDVDLDAVRDELRESSARLLPHLAG